MVAMVDFFEHRVQLAPEPLVFSDAKDLRDHVSRQTKHAQFARAFEDLMDGERAAKDEIPTGFDFFVPITACSASFPNRPSEPARRLVNNAR
jgi:hypothetical protein